nr:sensor histidine kinase [Amycolatopsis nigrescens]
MVGDSLIALLFGLFDLLLFVADADVPGQRMPPWYITVPLDLAIVLPLVVRRKYPLQMAYAVLVIGVPHSVLQLGAASLMTGAIALYTVVVYARRRQAAIYLVALVLVTAGQFTLPPMEDDVVVIALMTALSLALAWVLGEFVGARRAYHVEVEARLHLLETERDQATRIAVGEERSRIARELHDVVAHAVSVMVVQADGASYAIKSNPALAERAVQTISETGREALGDLRRLLDVLRNEDSDGEPRVPQPDTEALGELAERVRTAGVPVRLELTGELTGLPAGVSLGVYRIVQEALTNTLKHAGPGARAEVRVRQDDDVVEVEVCDDGAGRARQLVPPAVAGPLPGGNGLIGMRERAHVFGGELEVGPQPGGGWRVHATLPVRLAR